jgi:putative oxidoreductase
MKTSFLVARLLLGLIFLVFGLNAFLHFIPMPLPSGVAGQFMGALFVSRYLLVVASIQVLTAVLLLINRYVPLALALLAPIIVNILLFHILMAPSGIAPAVIATVLWGLVFVGVRSAFTGLFQQRVQIEARPQQRSTRAAQVA